MSFRIGRRSLLNTPDGKKFQGGLRKLQETIPTNESAPCSDSCKCKLCRSYEVKVTRPKNPFHENSNKSDKWLFQILNGLTSSGIKSLKIYIPDFCFIDGDLLIIFHNENKENRVSKVSGTTPLKSLFNTMVKLRKQYKGMLEETFHKTMIDEVDPEFMHEKYLDQLLPSHFHDGENSQVLSGNVNKFRKYILHKNAKYIINSIEEHKINDNQPFCTVRYSDANSQLFSKNEFQTFTLLKIPTDIVYVQSYIKEKQQTQSILTSSYTELSPSVDEELFAKAQLQILILIEGINKYSPDYQELEVLEDLTLQLMKQNPSLYCKCMTYKIIHFLAMVARIFIKHIKINWILNDLGFVYFQNIIEYQTSQLSCRTLRYHLPPKEDGMVFYKDSKNFLTLYKQMKMLRQHKRNKIRSELQRQQQIEEQSRKIEIKSERKSVQIPKINLQKSSELSRTIDMSTGSERNTIERNFLKRKKPSRYENYSQFKTLSFREEGAKTSKNKSLLKSKI